MLEGEGRDRGPSLPFGLFGARRELLLGGGANAVGVFGFSFLEENKNTLKDVPINGIPATYDTVSTGQYPGARPLYIYVKKAHMQAVPGLQAYLNIFASNWGPGGVLAKRGMTSAQNAAGSHP